MNDRWRRNKLWTVCSVILIVAIGCGETSGHATTANHVVSTNQTSNDKNTKQTPNVNHPLPQRGANVGQKRATSLPKSEADIVNEAVTQLQQLRGYYVSQIDALYSAAISDHRKHKLSSSQITSKYMPRAMQLSNASQDQVNLILFSLKRKLQNGGFPTTEVDVLRNEYYNEVRSKISELGQKR